jgi:hypothetical protein
MAALAGMVATVVTNQRTNKGVKALNTDDDILNRIQDNLIQAIEPLTRSSITNGILLQSKPLTIGNNIIDHGLGRQPLGLIVVSNSAGSVLSYSISNATTRSIPVNASIATTASFWVF